MDAYEFFLGGQDLEMVTIHQILIENGFSLVHDRSLGWGARASAYRSEIHAALNAGHVPVLIELQDDLGLERQRTAKKLVVIDHHGPGAGRDAKTSLEQVFELLDLPAEKWTRQLELVSANDRGHVVAMRRLNATREEMLTIRAEDRKAQGITSEEELAGHEAAAKAESRHGGQLTVVRLPNGRAATVTDVLAEELGGPGFQNLVIFSPGETFFFGGGWVISHLRSRYPDCWWGGELPERGYWGCCRAIDFGEICCLCEEVMKTKPAAEIPVRAYHLILQWPVLLRGKPLSEQYVSYLEPWVKELDLAGWTDETAGSDPNAPSTPVSMAFTYEQIVYFHPFVRDFLFGDGKEDKRDRAVRLLTRQDVKGLTVELGPPQPQNVTINLMVERMQLFVFKPNVAILTVEVSSPRYSNRDDVVTLNVLQDFQDQIRRLYPPFWRDITEKNDDAVAAGLCLRSLQWIGVDQQPIDVANRCHDIQPPPSSVELKKEYPSLALDSPKRLFDAFTRTGAEPPVFDHWRWFFGSNVRPVRTQSDIEGRISGNLYFQQLMDERMPVMSYIAVDQPTEISTGDYDRLSFIDASGTDAFPYQEEFLNERRSRFTYNRFAHEETKYLCSGYGFSVIGAAVTPNGRNEFFLSTIREHFRRHYFCLGLIAHYQKAALLYFADTLATAMKTLSGKELDRELTDHEFRRQIEEVQHRFLKFRSRSFFPEVTNQLQGRELFQMWFDILETQKLFDLVDGSSERLSSVLNERESMRIAEESRRLSEVAAMAVPLGIGFTTASVLLAVLQILEPTDWLCKTVGFLMALFVSWLFHDATKRWIKGIENRGAE